MAKQVINIGRTANDRSGDPLRSAFIKINENFTELYAATGADIQIPNQANNGGKYLTTDGTTLSWATINTNPSNTGNIGFVDDKIYDINGLVVSNDDLVHGATARLTIPAYGSFHDVNLLNYYGNVSITAGIAPESALSWTFKGNGDLQLPAGGDIVDSNGVSVLNNIDGGNASTTF